MALDLLLCYSKYGLIKNNRLFFKTKSIALRRYFQTGDNV